MICLSLRKCKQTKKLLLWENTTVLLNVFMHLESQYYETHSVVHLKVYVCTMMYFRYSWNQTVINSAGNLLTNPDFSDAVNVSFQLGVCQNVDSPMKGCEGTAPLFMVRIHYSHRCLHYHCIKEIVGLVYVYYNTEVYIQ